MPPGDARMISPGWRRRAGTELLAFEATAVKDGEGLAGIDRNRWSRWHLVGECWWPPGTLGSGGKAIPLT